MILSIILTIIYLLGLLFFGFLSAAFAANANTHIRLSKMSRFAAWKELWLVPIFWPYFLLKALILFPFYYLFKKEELDDEVL